MKDINENDIRKAIEDTFYGIKADRQFKVWTRAGGLKLFHEAMKKEFEKMKKESMDIKYYTPAIEDIGIGYCYEVFSKGKQLGDYGQFLPEHERDDEVKWRKSTCRNVSDILHVAIYLEKNEIRTPYLTKEQIEAEGWFSRGDGIFEKIDEGHTCIAQLYDEWAGMRNVIRIFYMDGDSIDDRYCGICPSINEFRKICKLLNI